MYFLSLCLGILPMAFAGPLPQTNITASTLTVPNATIPILSFQPASSASFFSPSADPVTPSTFGLPSDAVAANPSFYQPIDPNAYSLVTTNSDGTIITSTTLMKNIYPTPDATYTLTPESPLSDQPDFSSPFHDALGQPLHPAGQTPPHVPRTINPHSIFGIFKDLLKRSNGKKPLGINCRGKHYCGLDPANGHHLADTLSHLIEEIPDERVYAHGEKIACVRGIGRFLCAWVDYGSREKDGFYEIEQEWVSGRNIKRLAKEILNHGCKRCGSVPLMYPETNNGSRGYLTFNARRHSCASEFHNADSICITRNATLHGSLVGAEVDTTQNGTLVTDGNIDTK